jgi:hypothetical protein
MDLVKTKSSGSEKVEFNPPLDVDTGSMLLAAMKEMQQQLETRLSRIENVLQDMNSRLCLMETKVASS